MIQQWVLRSTYWTWTQINGVNVKCRHFILYWEKKPQKTIKLKIFYILHEDLFQNPAETPHNSIQLHKGSGQGASMNQKTCDICFSLMALSWSAGKKRMHGQADTWEGSQSSLVRAELSVQLIPSTSLGKWNILFHTLFCQIIPASKTSSKTL